MAQSSKKRRKKKRRDENKVRFIVMNLIRLILVFSVAASFLNQRWLVFAMAVFGLGVTFVPTLMKRIWNIRIPAEFEIITILFLYGLLLFADVNKLFGSVFVGLLLNIFSAVAVGFVGLTIMYSLHKEEKINASPFVIALFAFTFSVAFGAVWEVFEFSLDTIFSFSLQSSPSDTMTDLLVNTMGAFAVSVAGYYHIKSGKNNIISSYLTKFIEKNPRLFSARRPGSSDMILDLIKKGEGNDLEFKSTLRTNLHTNSYDRNLEHATLKTLCGYLNTEGGTLLVGVGDDGTVTGVEKDSFKSKDKLNLHFTNLLKNHIGPEYLPFISFDFVPVGDKTVLKVDCKKSHKHVFLSMDGREEFFVRNGASTARLEGRTLIDYVNHNFKKL